MSHHTFATRLTTFAVFTGIAALALACSKSSSSSGDKPSASAEPPSVALGLASSDAPKASPNSSSAAVVPISGAGSWDHHCDILATRTCVEWGQPDKNECDAAHGTYAPGPCMRSPLSLGTCVLATGKTSTGDPAPVKRILYNAGAGGAMKADNAHAMCDREALSGASDVTHMWKDGPAASRK